jgi:hypothetical protein
MSYSLFAGILALTVATGALAARPVPGDRGPHFLVAGSHHAGSRPPGLSPSGQILYFGGAVFSSVEVVSVLWGPKVARETVDGMPGFFKAIVDSTYIDQLKEYNTTHRNGVNGHKGSNQKIVRGTFFGQVQIAPMHKGNTVTDIQIHKELEYQIAQGNLSAQNANMLYMIYFPANVVIEAFGLTSCVEFSGYHYTTTKYAKPSSIYYGVNPDCGFTFDNHTLESSSVLADAITDNIEKRGAGTNPDFPQAWEDSTGYEIGDPCYGVPARLDTRKTSYTVQEVYLDSIPGCGTGNFTSP